MSALLYMITICHIHKPSLLCAISFNYFIFPGLFWGMLGDGDQGQRGDGLRAVGGDAGQRFPSGHRVQHPEGDDPASHHPENHGQHPHRSTERHHSPHIIQRSPQLHIHSI